MTLDMVLEHLYIVFMAVIVAIAIGIPLGVITYLVPKVRRVILFITDIFQTIPSLALLGMIMVIVGAGKTTVIIGLSMYSLLPIVRNTNLGLSNVDPGIKEAARGMGMSRLYQLLFIELPLSFPIIFTGIKIATVNSIGTAIFAASVGGGGLGSIIYRGIRVMNVSMILSATASLMVMSIAFETIMDLIAKKLEKKAT
ncbi:MAG: ABC transporter permease [Erysipelotrichaceae bacterium]|nr:ABC transporter permease [Erysipelotrichaceae bacterium]MDD3923923.1 ABC transporter permease [Erysipelotrichaceae bacterium]MDD4642700.1 ABC transporter permease [Erysipelotrichaceae bacterium]